MALAHPGDCWPLDSEKEKAQPGSLQPVCSAADESLECCPACGFEGMSVMGDWPHRQCFNPDCRVHRFRDIAEPKQQNH
jgi:hypothetical protein